MVSMLFMLKKHGTGQFQQTEEGTSTELTHSDPANSHVTVFASAQSEGADLRAGLINIEDIPAPPPAQLPTAKGADGSITILMQQATSGWRT
jgi:hypothetical protein